ncbi:Autoimmune regulator [Parasponia andersonii]|uniref:Autoimmune regulator n=1 Tax=Parasponia andersonii TaxID=3476 RepID=A0A2P5AED1_PARAD|nr:Autoimmune regulator [Parasponia andersonii]
MVLGVKDDNGMALQSVKKRRICKDLPDFFEFPPRGGSATASQPFRDSVKAFLSSHARLTLQSSLFPSLLAWSLDLRSPAPVVLHIVEEDVTTSRRSVYCDHCRVVGWSGHPVCTKRYHFIIRAEQSEMASVQEDEGRTYPNSCLTCGASVVHLSESRCKSCNSCVRPDDMEDWLYLQLEDNRHLLHAVVHSNGFGHLLTLNGIQGGSRFLSGHHIMDFWDRLCQTLSVRKISVMDVSKKHGMEYRLLHAVTSGHSWYGNWGYGFGAGSYALTQDVYRKAIDFLSSMPLSPFLFQARTPRSRLQSLIAFYQSLSDTQLATFKDLFSFLLSRTLGTSQKPLLVSSNVLCAWTMNDVELLQQAMVKVLRASSGGWVARRALKGAICKAASSELLDYSLKHFGGKVTADGLVVCSRCSPFSCTVEYRLEPLSITTDGSGMHLVYPSEDQVICDLKFLYESLLHPDTMASYKPKMMRDKVIDSANKLLDCKQFMKVYVPENAVPVNPHADHLWCDVQLSDQPKGELVVPPELVVLPLNATVGDLKGAVTLVFREVYPLFKSFQAEQLVEYGSVDDNITVKFLVGSSESIRLEGKCPAKHGLIRFRKERGIESWTVDCFCGAKDDDGERMLACDTCGVWQHTRCLGIDNSDDIPAKFVCLRCKSLYSNELGNIYGSTKDTISVSVPRKTCRGKAALTSGLRLAANLTMTSDVL